MIGAKKKMTFKLKRSLICGPYKRAPLYHKSPTELEDPANEQLLEIRILLILSLAHSMHSNEERDMHGGASSDAQS